MRDGTIAHPQDTIETSEPGSKVLQGWIIVSTSWLAVAAAAVVAPVAPAMAQHFASMPGAEGLVQLSIGLPALFVALLGGPIGYLADRIGRRLILLVALMVYAICGTAPLMLDALPNILLSRVGVGIAEAAVMATGTAFLGDLFQGKTREKWFAIQGGSATIIAVVLITVSGALAENGWRAPFVIYFAPLLMALLVARFTPEPARSLRGDDDLVRTVAWMHVARICGVSFLTAIAFYIVLIQLPFLLVERGFAEPRLVAIGAAAGAVTAPIGAYLFHRFSHTSVPARMAMSFALSAAGLALIVLSHDYTLMLLGAGINGIGSGVALPTLMTAAMAGLRLEQRGRVGGFWNASFFLGQFLSPLVFIGATTALNDRTLAFGVFAGLLAVGAALALGLALRRRDRVAAV